MNEPIQISLNKKGISVMIGYILLISGAVIMGALVYQWMKTYIPKDPIDCPDGVSLSIVESECSKYFGENKYQLKLTLKNNGRFDIGGYFIHATDNETQTLAVIDLSKNLTSGGEAQSNAVIFQGMFNNFLESSKSINGKFNITNPIFSIEIIPIRWQVYDNKKRLVSCSQAKIVDNINCVDNCIDADANGCRPEIQCGDDSVCGGTSCGTCDLATEGVCNLRNNQCQLCGNGQLDAGEECDDGNTDDGDGCSSGCMLII